MVISFNPGKQWRPFSCNFYGKEICLLLHLEKFNKPLQIQMEYDIIVNHTCRDVAPIRSCFFLFHYSISELYATSKSDLSFSLFGPTLFNRTSIAFSTSRFISSIGTSSPFFDLDKASNSLLN